MGGHKFLAIAINWEKRGGVSIGRGGVSPQKHPRQRFSSQIGEPPPGQEDKKIALIIQMMMMMIMRMMMMMAIIRMLIVDEGQS